MCSISGIFGSSASRDIVERMNAAQKHRGPDGHGITEMGHVVLGNTRLDFAGVDSYLATGSVESPLTIVDGVKQLLPGHYLRATANQAGEITVSEVEFMCPPPRRDQPRSRDEAVARLRAELEHSVRLH